MVRSVYLFKFPQHPSNFEFEELSEQYRRFAAKKRQINSKNS
jgi:hypothetical protein